MATTHTAPALLAAPGKEPARTTPQATALLESQLLDAANSHEALAADRDQLLAQLRQGGVAGGLGGDNGSGPAVEPPSAEAAAAIEMQNEMAEEMRSRMSEMESRMGEMQSRLSEAQAQLVASAEEKQALAQALEMQTETVGQLRTELKQVIPRRSPRSHVDPRNPTSIQSHSSQSQVDPRDPTSIQSRSHFDPKSIQSRSKVDPKSNRDLDDTVDDPTECSITFS